MSTKTKKSESAYQLKKGVIFTHNTKVYSEHNLTDKVAKDFLKKNPNRKKLFSMIPTDKQEEVTILGKEFTIDGARELLSQIEVNTKAKTVDGIMKVVDSLDEDQKSEIERILTSDEEE